MVEEDSLENYCVGNGTVGSNPTLSANLSRTSTLTRRGTQEAEGDGLLNR